MKGNIMEYSKEYLIKKAITRLDCLEESLKDLVCMANDLNAERELVRYLLYLGFEKENTSNEGVIKQGI
jgi:hypothetical protein